MIGQDSPFRSPVAAQSPPGSPMSTTSPARVALTLLPEESVAAGTALALPEEAGVLEVESSSKVVRLRMRDPQATVSRHLAMDGWMEQQLQAERDEAIEDAGKAQRDFKQCKSELRATRMKAVSECKALKAEITALKRGDKSAVQEVRVAVHRAQEQCKVLDHESKGLRRRYKWARNRVYELEKELAAADLAKSKLQDDFSILKKSCMTQRVCSIGATCLL